MYSVEYASRVAILKMLLGRPQKHLHLERILLYCQFTETLAAPFSRALLDFKVFLLAGKCEVSSHF